MNVRFETVHVGRMNGRALGPEFVAFHQPNHAVSVQYRSLIAEIATQLPGAKPRVLLIVSAAVGSLVLRRWRSTSASHWRNRTARG